MALREAHTSHLNIACAGQPPVGSEPTGDMVRWGRELKPVYRLDMRKCGDDYLPVYTEVVPLVIDGKTQMKYVGGQPVAAKTHRVIKKEFEENPDLFTFEFIVVNGGNGIERIERNFRPNADDTARSENERLNDPAFLSARLAALEARMQAELAQRDARLNKYARVVKEVTGLDGDGVEELMDEAGPPAPEGEVEAGDEPQGRRGRRGR